MSYSVITPCFGCIKKAEGCTDGIVITGAVQGIIHSTPTSAGHKGSGTVTMVCCNKVEK